MTIARVADHAVPVEEFASDVHYYLSLQPRQLPSRYFYDDLGSALFDAICRLPWYRITGAETRLLADHGRAILSRVAGLSTVVELGPGSGEKLATLVEAGRSGPGLHPHLDLRLVDISASALELASRTLATLPDVSIATYQARYETGLRQASAETPGGSQLVLFLGSNIGNFDRPGAGAFLRGVRAGLAAGDMLLLGADLVKPERDLILAYDDPLGVTAAFNRNLLVRINRELGGTFDIDAFAHRAAWVHAESRVEMHLVSRARQRVHVEAAGIEFVLADGESIWTESSYKYTRAGVVVALERAGFRLVEQWIDEADGFALTLVEAF
ncbi:MAG TPA: L-histidine N(alpha)-methyltransferase [Vicinamibacterales bacterium]|nr:L-histidine N(alpha)-methyltransferase [Vicinamibacterales bacterium]